MAMSRGLVALALFMDVSGDFDNTAFVAISRASSKRGIDRTIRKWILAMLKDRQIRSLIGDCETTVLAAKGCPQGGVLSPLLWSIVIDDLLHELNGDHIFTIGYADDIVIVIVGKFLPTIREIMSRAMRRTLDWCAERGLSINPLKTVAVPFHTRRKLDLQPLVMEGVTIPYSEEVTYLGIKLDRKLSWKPHLQWTLSKAQRSLWACRNLLGKSWGLGQR